MSQRTRNELTACGLFVGLFALYLSNAVYCVTADSAPNIYLTMSLLGDGDFTMTPREAPCLFHWRLKGSDEEIPVTAIDARLKRMIDQGELTTLKEMPFLVPSVQEGRYVSTFGPGPAIVALPAYAIVEQWFGDLTERPRLFWYTGKVVAAACIAGAAVVVFLTLLRLGTFAQAAVCALVYGLGTAAWTTGSQGLYQHGPNQLFLALGAYFLVRSERETSASVWCGLALAAATCCRPTSAMVVLAVAVYLLIVDRARLARFVLAGAPLAVLLGWYNWHYLGSPTRFAQSALEYLPLEKTGKPGLFQTPLWVGAYGLLFSPSRGLFVFSPVLLFSIFGAWNAFRNSNWRPLRPLIFAIAAIWCIEFKHFDWWGGWSYGYRHLADTTVLLALLIAPALSFVATGSWRNIAFAALVLTSILVQALGAFTYDARGWNAREGFEVRDPQFGQSISSFTHRRSDAEKWAKELDGVVSPVTMDIDIPRFRSRFWSVDDSQIVYYATHLAGSRRGQREFSDYFFRPIPIQLAATYDAIGRAKAKQGHLQEAEFWNRIAGEFRSASEVEP